MLVLKYKKIYDKYRCTKAVKFVYSIMLDKSINF
jgi:hypothetical protein